MSKRDKYDTIDSGLLKALSHPLRQRILLVLNQRVASPAEISVELSEPLGNVSYHVKILEQRKAIELVTTRPVRGAVEHFYRALVRPKIANPDHWASLPLSVRRELFDQNLQQIWDHSVKAAEAHGFDDTETHISWTHLELDEQAYRELGDDLAALVDRATDLQAAAAARLAKLPEEERDLHRTELAIMHYHRDGQAPTKKRQAQAAQRTSR